MAWPRIWIGSVRPQRPEEPRLLLSPFSLLALEGSCRTKGRPIGWRRRTSLCTPSPLSMEKKEWKGTGGKIIMQASPPPTPPLLDSGKKSNNKEKGGQSGLMSSS
eukprot:Sspe_Gene.90925::Locus_62410_Transcript_1_1_Confidence_1.000_Length_788::g.90925::m.90925